MRRQRISLAEGALWRAPGWAEVEALFLRVDRLGREADDRLAAAARALRGYADEVVDRERRGGRPLLP